MAPLDAIGPGHAGNEPLVIGLVNNMPDAAFWNTERQFRQLLSAAAPARPVQLRRFIVKEVPRAASAREVIMAEYEDVEALWGARLDGLIVTGAEPRSPDLANEPFSPTLTKLVAWADDRTTSTIWSCLAAHAAVLCLSGIERQPFQQKLSGVFACAKAAEHKAFADMPACWRTPHSRHNGLAEETLAAHGYQILSYAAETGADMFARHEDSLFLFLQGHPEYDRGALLREYRRDVGRFLSGQWDRYPAMPCGYFDEAAADCFAQFREQAELERAPQLMQEFPAITEAMIADSWGAPARSFYRGWLDFLVGARQAHRRPVRAPAMATAYGRDAPAAPLFPPLVAGPRPPRSQAKPMRDAPSPGGPPPAPGLFPNGEERRRWDDFLTRELGRAQLRVAAGGVSPTLDLDSFRTQLADFDFAAPRPLGDVLDWTIATLESGVVHMTHPRYLGLFNPAPSFPSQCADRIAAAFNPQLASRTTSPAATAIESHVIRAVAERTGLPAGARGSFTNGGAEANYTAVLCALTRACPGFATEGARAFAGPPTFYVSRDSHLAWLKIAHQAGIGRSGVRMIATDGQGRMDAAILAATLERDRAEGCVPVMVAATAGTTGAGMVDPLPACAAIAHDEGLWFHVDAAWGGAAIASDRLRPHLDGIALADSVTLDAHKWFATTMGCGMFITAHPAFLPSVFGVSASFMPPSDEPDLDPYVTSIQWSRRFLGLRLFLALAAAGWDGYAAHVERAAFLAGELARTLAARGWRIVNDPALAVVCAEPPPGSAPVRTLVGRVVASGRAWVSAASFEGHDVVRAAITHGETTLADIAVVADALQAAG